MPVTVIGTALTKGAPDFEASGYIVQTDTPGGADIDMEDFDTGVDGSRVSRHVYKVDGKRNFEAITTNDETQINTDFPEGNMCTLAAFGTQFFIDSLQIAKSRAAWRVTVTATDIGIT